MGIALLIIGIDFMTGYFFDSFLGQRSADGNDHGNLFQQIEAYAGIAVFAFFLTRQWQFWVLAVIVGMFQGGVQALSRSHFAKIIPPEKSGEYFGLFDICGKGASFLGTMIVSVGSQLTGSANVGVGSLIVLFVVGFVLFRVSCKAGVITDSVN